MFMTRAEFTKSPSLNGDWTGIRGPRLSICDHSLNIIIGPSAIRALSRGAFEAIFGAAIARAPRMRVRARARSPPVLRQSSIIPIELIVRRTP